MGFNIIVISLVLVCVNFSMFKILVPVSNFKVCVVSSEHILACEEIGLYNCGFI